MRKPGHAVDELGPGVGAPVAGVGGEVGPEEQGGGVGHLGEALREHELADGSFRSGNTAGPDPGAGPAAVEAPEPAVDVDGGEALADERVVGPAEVAGQVEEAAEHVGSAGPAAAGGPLEPERGEGDPPSVADVAEAGAVGNGDVGRGTPR